MTIRYEIGDARTVMGSIPDGSISLIATSPPFLALRSYLPADHAGKDLEIGSEASPAEYLDVLLGLTAEWGRVLAPWGSIAVELGDTYSGNGRAGGDYNDGGLRDSNPKFNGSAKFARTLDPALGHPIPRVSGTSGAPGGTGWPLAKCLTLIPQLYAVALAYGINPLTGAPSPAGRWRVRNVVVWHRPNPAVGALGDKFRPSTSYITVATRSAKRWFDLTAVRTEHKHGEANARGSYSHGLTGNRRAGGDDEYGDTVRDIALNPAGAPPLDAWFDEYDGTHDTWTLTTQPSGLAHYAMWPAKLAERLILSMCPAEVCRECGEPRRRIEGKAEYVNSKNGREVTTLHFREGEHRPGQGNTVDSAGLGDRAATRQAPTLGWTDCGHDDYEPGVVLDPFAGTGTSLCVAELHGRDSVGIDIDPRNRDLMPRRMEECRRALFGVRPELPDQLDMFAGAEAPQRPRPVVNERPL